MHIYNTLNGHGEKYGLVTIERAILEVSNIGMHMTELYYGYVVVKLLKKQDYCFSAAHVFWMEKLPRLTIWSSVIYDNDDSGKYFGWKHT